MQQSSICNAIASIWRCSPEAGCVLDTRTPTFPINSNEVGLHIIHECVLSARFYDKQEIPESISGMSSEQSAGRDLRRVHCRHQAVNNNVTNTSRNISCLHLSYVTQLTFAHFISSYVTICVSFTFLQCEILREINGKVKDDFLANILQKLRCHGTVSTVMFISKHEAQLLLLFLR